MMLAAEKGKIGVCEKLAELGADLNLADKVRQICSNRVRICYCIIILLPHFFELGTKDGLDVGCREVTSGSVFETG